MFVSSSDVLASRLIFFCSMQSEIKSGNPTTPEATSHNCPALPFTLVALGVRCEVHKDASPQPTLVAAVMRTK